MLVNFYPTIWYHYPENDIPHDNTYQLLIVLGECSVKKLDLFVHSLPPHSWSLKVSSILNDFPIPLSELSEYYKEILLLPSPGQWYRFAAYVD